MSLPSNRIVPAVGGRNPDSRLKHVVFPAPLGPINPTISPSSTVRSTPLTAARPPKYRLRPRDSRRGMGQPAGLGVGAAAARLHRKPDSFPGNGMLTPGRHRIARSIAIEEQL